MKRIPSKLQKKLKQRAESNTLRVLSEETFEIDFWSNDYLGFSKSAEIQALTEEILKQHKIQNGATGSRLISGNFPLYTETENYIASFHNAPKSLIFNSGYDANIGIFSCIPQKNDLILYDQYIHASIRDGITLSAAKSLKFRHNDMQDLENLLKKFSSEVDEIFIVTESVFSMDGDSPDFEKLVSLSETYAAFLIVDEAHSLGVFGKKGEGLVQELGFSQEVFLRLVTFGKGLGAHGAAVLSDEETISYLVNFARSFIYTTGLSVHSVASIYAGYQQLSGGEERRKLFQNISFFKKKIIELKMETNFIASNSPIQAMLFPDVERLKKLAFQLQKENIGIKPIFAPTIPKGEERLRICLHSFNTEGEMSHLINCLKKEMK